MSNLSAQKALGQRLRQLRLKKGLTQQQLAGASYTPAYISTIEAGRRYPSPKALAHLATGLGIEPDVLITGRPSDLPAQLDLKIQESRVATAQGRYEEATKGYQQAASQARRYKSLGRIEAKSQEGLGLIAERRGDPEKALEHFETAHGLLANEPLHLRAEAVAGIARCTQLMGDVRYAIHILESYVMQLERERMPDPTALMRAHSSLIWPYSETGLYEKAQASAEIALTLEAKVEDPEKVATMHLNVARELLRQERQDDALNSLRRAEELFQSLNWKPQLAGARINRAIVLADRGELTAARDELRSALDTIEATTSTLSRVRALTELGRVERLLGNIDDAKKALNDALSQLRDVDVTEQAHAHRQLGLCYADDEPAFAEKNLRIAIELYERAEEPLHLAVTYRDLGDLLFMQGDVDGGRDAYRDGLVCVEKL